MIDIDKMNTLFECDMFKICQENDKRKRVAIEFKRNSTGGGGGGTMSYDDDRDHVYMQPDKFVEFTETFKKIKLYIETLYENFYEKHYKELSKTSDDVEWIEQEASRLAEIDLDNFEMEG